MSNEYRNGNRIEDVLKTRLERYGCDIVTEERIDHAYKLDFVVTRFKGIDRMQSIGVQVTTRPRALEKMDGFLRQQQRHPYTQRALYIELCDVSDEIANGIDLIIFSALIHFAFSTDFNEATKRVYGFRIQRDWTTTFFDLQQEVSRLRAAHVAAVTPTPLHAPTPPPDPAPAPSPRVASVTINAAAVPQSGLAAWNPDAPLALERQPGFIVKIHERGYGFLDTQEGKRYFFALSRVEDPSLKAELDQIQSSTHIWASNLRIPVEFKDCGMIRSDASNPQADCIVRRRQTSAV